MIRKKCFEVHENLNVPCDKKECRQWIDYENDLNCTIVCANKNGPLTLHEAADRLGVSFVRVKQNQDSALKKLMRKVKTNFDDVFGS